MPFTGHNQKSHRHVHSNWILPLSSARPILSFLTKLNNLNGLSEHVVSSQSAAVQPSLSDKRCVCMQKIGPRQPRPMYKVAAICSQSTAAAQPAPHHLVIYPELVMGSAA